jgi:glycosyltransferase involved in cell wall biosynthesis
MLFKIKKHLYSRSNFTVVTPSEWLKQVASQSPLLTERNIRCINNGLNLELYQPVAKQQARQILGIESGFQVVLFASSHWSAAFKGYAYFERAILSLKETKPNLFLLGFGIGDFSEELKSKFPTLTLGYVNHEKIKSLSYSAADVFIFPTMAEAFGNVAIESMSCGTPVVGFKTGGLADSIVHLETGYLAEPGNVEDLARGILTLLNDDRLRENMAEKGRERAIDKFTLEIQAKNYLEAYKKEIEMFKSLN